MTIKEYENWMNITESSKYRWMHDECQSHNHGIELFYKGGVNGEYVEITPEGDLMIGSYEGAYPHIGEAFFDIKAKKNYGTKANAIQAAIEKGGMLFLISFLRSIST